MADYRLYRLDAHSQILDGKWIEAASDADAITAGKGWAGASPLVEIWCGKRRVACVSVEPPA